MLMNHINIYKVLLFLFYIKEVYETHAMAKNNKFLFKKVVPVDDDSGELKVQYTVEVTPWDTSTMENYREGDVIKKGFTCCIKTLKPNKKYPRGRIYIDPTDPDLREALREMYAEVDKLVSKG